MMKLFTLLQLAVGAVRAEHGFLGSGGEVGPRALGPRALGPRAVADAGPPPLPFGPPGQFRPLRQQQFQPGLLLQKQFQPSPPQNFQNPNLQFQPFVQFSNSAFGGQARGQASPQHLHISAAHIPQQLEQHNQQFTSAKQHFQEFQHQGQNQAEGSFAPSFGPTSPPFSLSPSPVTFFPSPPSALKPSPLLPGEDKQQFAIQIEEGGGPGGRGSSFRPGDEELNQLADEVREGRADRLVERLLQMMQDPVLAQDEEYLTATMIRLVEEPTGKQAARRVRVPLQLLTLLRSALPLGEKRETLDRLSIRLMEKEEFEHPTLQIVEEPVAQAGLGPGPEMFEDVSEGQRVPHPRVPRGRLEPGQRFQFPGRLQPETRRPKQLGGDRKAAGGRRKKPKKRPRKKPTAKRPILKKPSPLPSRLPPPPPAKQFEVLPRDEPASPPRPQGGQSRRPKAQISGKPNGPDNNFGFPSSFGQAGVDFPMYDQNSLPGTSFSCRDRVNGGFYADTAARCQMYHMCVADPAGNNAAVSFLCPNGTLFSQETLACGMWHSVDCQEESVQLLSQLNDALEAEREFITLGLEASDPVQDFPWRNRDVDTGAF